MSMSSRPAPGYREKPLTVACVQFDPKLRDVEGNARRIREMTSRIQPNKIDLLVLPEMALTGYMYTSLEDIQDVLEDGKTGSTATLCSELARKMKCWVIAGFPEKVDDQVGVKEDETDNAGQDDGNDVDVDTIPEAQNLATAPGSTVSLSSEEFKGTAYNSAVIVSPSGTVYDTYRKSFLFETDKAWAKEGQGFRVYDLPQPLGRTVVAICMDMNPKDFLAPFNAYELASFVYREKADLLVVPMNWLNPPEELPPSLRPEESTTAATRPRDTGPDMSTLNYWAHRLTPLHDPAPGYTPDGLKDESNGVKEVVFVTCNRVGVERGTTFVGTSCVMTMSHDPSVIDLIEAMGVEEEGVMFALVN